MKENNNDSKNLLLQYAGFAMQLLVSLGIAVFVGLKLDKIFNISIPLLVWLLPLIVLILLIIKVIKDTSNKQ